MSLSLYASRTSLDTTPIKNVKQSSFLSTTNNGNSKLNVRFNSRDDDLLNVESLLRSPGAGKKTIAVTKVNSSNNNDIDLSQFD